MPDDYEPRMTDLEFQKFQLKRQQNANPDPYNGTDIGICAHDDWELQGGDCESGFEATSDSSRSLCPDADSGDEKEFNLNCSFTGGYLPNTDISRVDKGLGNPQFSGVTIR